MTRDEAMKKLAEVVYVQGGNISERSIGMSLDGYVALGMLKLDEPKSADEQFIQAIINHGFHKSVGEQVLGAIQVAGLKIVSK